MEKEEQQRLEREEAARKQAAEEKRKEEEERQRVLAEQRLKARRAIEEVRGRVAQARLAFAAKAEQRGANLNAATTRLDVNLKALDASIKKNETQIKKLKLMSADKEKEILKGIREVNMSKFISEVVDAVAEAKIKAADVPAMVNILSAMHQRYSDMTKLLIPRLSSVFAPLTSEALLAESEAERKERLGRRRSTLRLLTELLVAGIYSDGGVLIQALQRLIDQESKAVFADARAMLFTIVAGFVKYAGDVLPDVPPSWRTDAEDLLAPYRARLSRQGPADGGAAGAGEDGMEEGGGGAEDGEQVGDSGERGEAENAAADAVNAEEKEEEEEDGEDVEEGACNDDLLSALEEDIKEAPLTFEPSVLDAQEHAQLQQLLANFYAATVKQVFAKCEALHKQLKYNRQQIRQRGDLDETHVKDTETAQADFDKMMANCRLLADALGQEVPEMPPEPVEETRMAGDIVLGGKGGGEEEDFGDNVWEDAEAKDFYEQVPDLFEIVPAVLLGEEAVARHAERQAKRAEEAAAAAAAAAAGEGAEEGAAVVKEVDEAKANTAEEQEKAAAQVKAEADAAAAQQVARHTEAHQAGRGGEAEEEEDASAVERAKFDEFVANLYTCQSRDLIDQAAERFCYLNTKVNRRKLARALFQLPRGNLALLPYMARFVAVLDTAMPDIAIMLADYLAGEFKAFTRPGNRGEFMMEAKVRNVRMQGELFKFGLIKAVVVLGCLQTFIDDFAFQNIELACSIIEVCGRLLYRTKVV